MRKIAGHIFYSFPVQLFILHFRKYQVLLIIWVLLASTINSGFMQSYGADALFFMPEYLGQVNALSAAIVGVGMGVFFMSWNITTFILHTHRFKFLATASKPFLKYCTNNAILPVLFLLFYLVKSIRFNMYKELMSTGEEISLVVGFIGGFLLLTGFSFAFFFHADRRILRKIAPVVSDPAAFKSNFDPHRKPHHDGFGMKVGYYFSTRFRLRKARPVSHYSQDFLDEIFKRHHFSAMIGVVMSFIFLIICGFFLDGSFFQVPAATSILIFFSILVAVIGALSYFLQSWSLLFIIALVAVLNVLYRYEVIDPRNKAYGLNYTNKSDRPDYNSESLQQLCTPEKIRADKQHMLQILDNWKKKQISDKPIMVFINVSGGGLRSATFTMNTLQHLDSATNGQLFKQTFLISGASGGMLSAAYFRELYRYKIKGKDLDLGDRQYTDAIAQDLLNPVFSSMISRDLFSPAQKFSVGPYRYVKDRGYAFEEKLNENSDYVLSGQLKDYFEDEQQARIPLMFFNAVITRDGRKLVMGSQPLSFMMKPLINVSDTAFSPDAVDFSALFSKQGPENLRLLTALRMNATFPYVLPNVWLPSNPVIDVMDAGLRDNFGQETTLRFLDHFKDWISQNTGGVVIIQLRDRLINNWQQPLGTGSITDLAVKPATMLEHNWYKFQDYFQTDQLDYISDSSLSINRVTFMYTPKKTDQGAALNFHLTAAEKKDVIESFHNDFNKASLGKLLSILYGSR